MFIYNHYWFSIWKEMHSEINNLKYNIIVRSKYVGQKAIKQPYIRFSYIIAILPPRSIQKPPKPS